MVAIVALLVIGETNGTPERLNIAEHFGSERPDARHPIAVEAPNQIVTDQVVELVSTNANPIAMSVAWKTHEPNKKWVYEQFSNPHADKDRYCKRGNPHSDKILPCANKLVEEFYDPRSFARLGVQ